MKHVLIVDDKGELRESLYHFLTEEGFEVTMAKDGHEAVKQFEENPAKIVVTDILMPDKDGLELIKDIRGICSEVKILAVSGGGQIEPDVYLKWAKKVGADAALQKPYSFDQILEIIQGWTS